MQTISIHAPQWGATRTGTTITNGFTHFNPRTPVGCDLSTEPNRSASPVISIHAPQWGATAHRPTGVRTHSDFNPRTPVGCDRKTNTTHKGGNNFNPRTPVGCDRPERASLRRRTDFNPRTPVGCDEGFRPSAAHCIFQSTHPSGVRPRNAWFQDFRQDFNPRTPVGCDGLIVPPAETFAGISIHAPQWGATWPERTWASTPTNFNPRTPVGCDAQTGKDAGDHFKFQSTHPSGVRLGDGGETWRHRSHFNPRTPVGCDRPTGTSRRTPPYFNPRTPVGCDGFIICNHM